MVFASLYMFVDGVALFDTAALQLIDCSISDLLRLVSGSGDIKLTKDGNVLLNDMVSHWIPLTMQF